MSDLAQHIFELGTAMNKAVADSLAHSGPKVVVTLTDLHPDGIRLQQEPHLYPRCHADVFSDDGLLTITAMDGQTVREYVAGEWVDATAYGSDGHICYSLRPRGAR